MILIFCSFEKTMVNLKYAIVMMSNDKVFITKPETDKREKIKTKTSEPFRNLKE